MKKTYPVISRKTQVWDEVTYFEAVSEEDAIDQARAEDCFHYATMLSEEIHFIRIAREDEVDQELISHCVMGDI